MNVYVIKVGSKLYIENYYMGLNPRTTKELLHAKFYEDEEQAEKIARKMRGSVVKVSINESTDEESELDMLRASVTQLQKERDAALNELNLYKLNETKGGQE